MSGFVAVVNTDGAPVDRDLLGRLTASMAFRGPDAQRTWVDGPVGLGHTLLATVDDYPEVPQPCSLDGRVWMVGDVRVDGRADLVAKLKDHVRAPLDVASDPELVLHAYHTWGEHCVDHLIGDFAFAVWDGERRRLFCARDQMGVKPIYYARSARALLVVSNTLDAVRGHPRVSDELDEGTIGDFLLFGHAVEPTATAYADVRRLPAAHTLTYTSPKRTSGVTVGRYWTLPVEAPVRYRRVRDHADRFTELLNAAVGDRLRAKRIAISMSGGLDSSSVAAVARRLRPDAEWRAYTAVSDTLIPDDERVYAGRVAEHLGIPIEYQCIDAFMLFRDSAEHPVRTPAPVDAPFWADDAQRWANIRHWGQVALTGHGGDAGFLPWPGELFTQLKGLRIVAATHDLWRATRVRGRLPAVGLRSAVERVSRGRRPQVADVPPWLAPDFAARVGAASRVQEHAAMRPVVHRYRHTAYESLTHPFWDFVLEGYDAGVTRQPIQFRHPLLDVRVLRYLLTMPTLPFCVDKQLLREVMQGALPEKVRLRPKTALQGDPVLAALRRGQVASGSGFAQARDLARFVHPDQIPSLEQLSANPHDMWVHLRPRNLARWLASTQITYRATSNAAPSMAYV